MGSFGRKVKRNSQILRKDRVKHNSSGEKKGSSRTPSAHELNTKTIYTHAYQSWLDVDELPPANKSCDDCYGTGIAGFLVDNNREPLICRCVAKQIKPKETPEEVVESSVVVCDEQQVEAQDRY